MEETTVKITLTNASQEGEPYIIDYIQIGQDEVATVGVTYRQVLAHMQQSGWNLKGVRLSSHRRGGSIVCHYVRPIAVAA